MTDTLQRFVFKDTCVRGEIIRLDSTLKVILQQKPYATEICDLLSQTLCATALLSATLKYDGQLTMQFEGNGPLKILVAKCDNQYRIRGTAKWDEESLPNSLKADFENGQLVITIQKNKPNQRYQSIVKINHQSISQSLEGYFLQSEQLETRLWLAYDSNRQEAVGLLLQKLPDEATSDGSDADNQWQHIQTLANTITDKALFNWNNEVLLHNLFHEETIQLFEPHPVQFYCPCSADKMLNAITTLGEQEALNMLTVNRFIEVVCEYCNNHFEFNEDEIKRLFTRH
ncbi:MAG: Hsp33 family molecular chaperone HslO [Gammaproteobacteria bacterium]|nr:Hsp33 family molecular chaperone HslO [Gammaproteobacteria bacterium]